jgi:hypothetical protein
MDSQLINLMYEVELQPGEQITIPKTLVEQIGAGRWRIKIEAIPERSGDEIRRHDAFLNGYAPEDEGLYDDYVAG